MSNPIKVAQDELHKLLNSAIAQIASENDVSFTPAFNIEIPADKSHGDFASNIALSSAKALKMPPRKIAELITEKIDIKNTFVEKCEIAGPGFINFFLCQKWFGSIVNLVLSSAENYGKTDTGSGKRVLIEFVSANPTGPMHIGNARGGAIGDCLASVMESAGYYVEREFYVNDAGNQIEKFGLSLEMRYMQIFDSSIKMPEDCYLGNDIIDHAKAYAEAHGDSLMKSSSEERRKALVDFALPKNIQKLKDDLLKYRITYDTWFLESELHNNNKVSEIIEKLKSQNATYEKDGAIWFKSTLYGEEKDRVIVRSNGLPTYVVPDIAYHYNKLVTRNFDIAIDVLGADHHGYVPRMRAALAALDIDPARLEVVIMQMVRLVKNGETYKLSKRSGKAITLETLLDEIPIDAARFFFNLREPNSHFDFDLDLAIEKSSQNPVFYVQYAHARICSILRRLGEGYSYENANFSLLSQPQEKELIRHLATLPNEIDEAARTFCPSVITRYTLDLAALFHKFYDACRVITDDEELSAARLGLCLAVKTVLSNTLGMMKITCPDQM